MSGTELFATFLGSVALLLWGVRMVRTGMTRAFGSQLRRAISTYARTRLGAFIAGVGILVRLDRANESGLHQADGHWVAGSHAAIVQLLERHLAPGTGAPSSIGQP